MFMEKRPVVVGLFRRKNPAIVGLFCQRALLSNSKVQDLNI